MGSGLCHPCPKTQMGLPSFATLPVTGAEGTWKTMPWLLKLLPKNTTHPFQSRFSGQMHVTWPYEPQGSRASTTPQVPGRRSAGQYLVTSADHYPKFSQLTCRADGHASSELSNLFWIRSPVPSPHFPRCLWISIHPVHTQPYFSILSLPFLHCPHSEMTFQSPY